MTSDRFKDLEELRRFLTLSAERKEVSSGYGFFFDVYVSWKFTGADAKSDSELFISALIHLVQDAQRRLNAADEVEEKAKKWDALLASVQVVVVDAMGVVPGTSRRGGVTPVALLGEVAR